jgi:hypothetical protein
MGFGPASCISQVLKKASSKERRKHREDALDSRSDAIRYAVQTWDAASGLGNGIEQVEI